MSNFLVTCDVGPRRTIESQKQEDGCKEKFIKS